MRKLLSQPLSSMKETLISLVNILLILFLRIYTYICGYTMYIYTHVHNILININRGYYRFAISSLINDL